MSAPVDEKFCPFCGATNPADYSYCGKCHKALPSAVAVGSTAAGPTTATTPAQSEPPSPTTPGDRRSRRRTVWTLIGVIVLAAIIIAAASILWYEYQPGNALNPYKVHVLEVVWTQSGSAYQTESGFTVKAGEFAHVSVPLTCTSVFGFSQTCESGSVYVETPGFGLSSSNAPFSWSSGSTSTTTAVNAVITTPSSSYTGNLTIDLH